MNTFDKYRSLISGGRPRGRFYLIWFDFTRKMLPRYNPRQYCVSADSTGFPVNLEQTE